MAPRIAFGFVHALGPLAAGLLLSLPGAARAEPPQDPHGIATFQVENDAVSTLKGTSDQYYTSGLRLGYVTPTTTVPSFLATLGQSVWGDGVQRVSIDLAQEIYTPRNTQLNPPDRFDHPYAGYLHVSAQLIHDTDTARSTLGVSLGIVGPSALGRQVQNGFHDIIGDTENKGWHYQLQDEPAVQLLGQRIWRLPVTQFRGLEMDALPAATLGLGTVRDYVQGGVSFRVGQGLNSDFGTPRIQSGMSGGDAYTPTRPFAWYVFAGADAQGIARDEFLDGSAFRSHSPQVRKKPYIGEMEAGLAVMYAGVRLTYTQTWQTESFYRQKSGLFSFGSFAASVRF